MNDYDQGGDGGWTKTRIKIKVDFVDMILRARELRHHGDNGTKRDGEFHTCLLFPVVLSMLLS